MDYLKPLDEAFRNFAEPKSKRDVKKKFPTTTPTKICNIHSDSDYFREVRTEIQKQTLS